MAERIYWPAGLESMTPEARVDAIRRGWWDVPTDDPLRFHRLYRTGARVEIFKQPAELPRAAGGAVP